jgi:hypothetical protein
MNSMRPVRTIAAALLVASIAVAGCSTRDTSPPSDAAPSIAAPATPAPDQPTPDQPAPRPPVARPPSNAEAVATSQPPRILQVVTTPKLSEMHGRLLLPDRVEIQVFATGADRARLVLTPTGTAAAYHSEVVAEATPAEDGLYLVWRPDDGVIGSLTIQVTGPGGSARHDIGDVYHE